MTGVDVDAVLWDIGQVIYPSPFERFDDVEHHVGLPPGTLPRGPFAATSDGYDEVDAGDRPEPDYWQGIERAGRACLPGFDVHVTLRELGWRGHARPVVLDVLADIPGRYRQGVLTNDSTAFLGAGWRADWELLPYFETIVDSVDIGVRKPDPAAYAAGATAFGLPPERILFVDDLTVNVVAARDAGMHAYRFDTTDPRAAVAGLRRLLDLGDPRAL